MQTNREPRLVCCLKLPPGKLVDREDLNQMDSGGANDGTTHLLVPLSFVGGGSVES